jgi:GNAT superfamily N-acetyltransferase
MPPAVRAARARGCPELARLRYEFRGDFARPAEAETEFLDRCAGWMGRRLEVAGGAWRCWVADGTDAIIGTAWLQLVEKLPNPVAEPEWHGYVSSLYVRPQYRGAGLGSALLRACLDECEARSVDAVILWPTPASRSLYLRHGFGERNELLARRLWKPAAYRADP